MEHVRVDGHASEREHLLLTTLDAADECVRQSVGTRAVQRLDAIGHLVSDERLRPREQDGHEELRPQLAGLNGPVVLVHDLRNDQVLEGRVVKPGMELSIERRVGDREVAELAERARLVLEQCVARPAIV